MRSKRAIYNIITNLVLQIVVILYGFIVPKIIIQSFGSDVNGLVTSITQFLAYITLLESGIGPVIKATLYKPISKNDNDSIINILYSSERFFRKIAYIFVFYLLLLAIIYPLLVKNEFDYLFTFSLIIIISISTFVEYYFGMTYKLYLQAEQKTYVISFIQILTYIINIIFIIFLAKLNFSIHIIKLVSGLVFIMRPLLQNYYVKKKYNITYNNVDKNYKLRQKWDGLAQHIASVIHNNTDITILTIFSTLSEVSVYSVYLLVLKGVNSLIQSFSNGVDASFGDMIAKGENDALNKKFGMYETIYLTFTSIIYICTFLLIIPFVSIYTKKITDANYVRPIFSFFIVISEFVWAIRLPYSSITLAAGHFKETRRGAWIEAVVNITISIILVKSFGIIGVAIGTLVAMVIRTIEFIYHANKYILNRNINISLKKVSLVVLESIITIFIFNFIPNFNKNTYFAWLIYSIIVLIITGVIILPINIIIYKNEFKNLLHILKKFRKKA